MCRPESDDFVQQKAFVCEQLFIAGPSCSLYTTLQVLQLDTYGGFGTRIFWE